MVVVRKPGEKMEKRLPIAMIVRLGHVQDDPTGGDELTYTDNVSVHGARVISRQSWHRGELARLTSLQDEITVQGKVVYCQKLPDDRYTIGLNFQERPDTRSTFRTEIGIRASV
jgi:PilZ domain-containing protein